MAALIRRTLLAHQAVEALRSEMRRGTWKEWLPGERSLSLHLGVSRPILRKALSLMLEDGWIAVEPRKGYRITSPRTRSLPQRPAEIHVLAPVPAVKLRLFTNLWLDELRRHLHESGHRLVLHDGQACFSARPAHALARLIRQHPAAAWILVHSGRETQEWFSAQNIPAIVAGSVHPKVSLPSVRVDVEAASRHAAARFHGLGHRRIAFLNARSARAGDHESEKAFLALAKQAGAEAQVIHHEPEPESVDLAVRRLISRKPRVTGLLVGHAHTYLSVQTSLARLGLRVPADISLIAREDELFFSALLPRPAVYRADPIQFARQLHRQLMSACAGQTKSSVIRSLIPEFVNGGSLRALPA